MFRRLQPGLDRFVPGVILKSGNRDLQVRARLLVGGGFCLAFVTLCSIPPTLLLEGLSLNTLVLVLAALAGGSAPVVLRFSGSLLVATTASMSALALALWWGAYLSGGFEGSTLRALSIVPLVATFIVNARLGVAFAIVMGLSIEVFYFADQAGYPFPEVPIPEGERWFSAQVAVLELAFITVFAWLFEASRREFTERLEASAGRSQAILNHMEDGVALFNAEGKLTRTNRAFSDLLRLGHAHSSGAHSVGLPLELLELRARVGASGIVERIRFELPEDRIGNAVVSPISEDGVVTGAVLLIRDITREMEVDRMKTDFIASVSHELRTPLTSILGFTKLTQNKLESRVLPQTSQEDAKVAKAVRQIRSNLEVVLLEGDRLTTMINDVLDISKMEAGAMEWEMAPVDPALLIERSEAATVALFVGDNKRISVEVAPNLPLLVGDFHRLQQVLINLISNGAKYCKQEVRVTARSVDGWIEFTVLDDGEGIAPAQLAQVFEKFRQLKGTIETGPSGTGLGLPISRQIVTAHSGQIRVESEVGHGARFIMTLPIPDQAQRA